MVSDTFQYTSELKSVCYVMAHCYVLWLSFGPLDSWITSSLSHGSFVTRIWLSHEFNGHMNLAATWIKCHLDWSSQIWICWIHCIACRRNVIVLLYQMLFNVPQIRTSTKADFFISTNTHLTDYVFNGLITCKRKEHILNFHVISSLTDKTCSSENSN